MIDGPLIRRVRWGIRVDVQGLHLAEGHDDLTKPDDVQKYARRFVATRLVAPIEVPPGEIWQRVSAHLVDVDEPSAMAGGELIGTLFLYDADGQFAVHWEGERDTPKG